MITATDGEAALELARSEHPDLCVLDVMMPKRSGFEVLKALREDESHRDMKVIMLTARTQDRDVDAGFSLGGGPITYEAVLTAGAVRAGRRAPRQAVTPGR